MPDIQLEASLSLENLRSEVSLLRGDLDKMRTEFTSSSRAIKEGFDGSSRGVEELRQSLSKISDLTGKAFDPSIVAKYGENLNTAASKILSSLSGIDQTKLTGLQQQLQGVNNNMQELQIIIKFLRENINNLGLTSQQIKALNQQFGTLDGIFKDLGDSSEGLVTKTNSLTKQLRAVKNELATIDDPSNPRFIQLSREGGELEEAIKRVNEQITLQASKTQLLDVGIQVVRGMVGGFEAARGAAALFGNENEDLHKTLVKLTGAMALLQGLQELGNILNSKSAVNIALLKLLNIQNTGAIVTETVALEGETVATEGATVATEGLNVAMAANPALFLLAAIAALAAIMGAFSKSASDADEKEKKLNETLAEQNQIMIELAETANESFRDRAKEADQQLALAQSQGKSENELFELRKKSIEAHRTESLSLLANLGFVGLTTDEIHNQIDALQAVVDARNEELHAVLLLTDKNGDLSKEDKARAEKLKSEVAALQPTINKGREALESVKTANNDLTDTVAANNLRLYHESLKSATAAAQASVLISTKGSREELNAKIDAVRKSATEELAQVNLTEGERKKIRAQAAKDIRDLNRDFQNRQTEDAISGQKAIENAERVGSEKAFAAKEEQLKLAAKEALNQEGITANKRLEIETKLQHDLLALDRERNIKRAQDLVNPQIEDLTAELSHEKFNTEERLKLQQDLIDKQAILDRVSIVNSTLSDEEKQAKLKEIDAKAFGARTQLYDDFIKTSIKADEDYQDSLKAVENAGLEAIVSSSTASYFKKFEARQKLLNNEVDSLQRQRADIKEEYDKGVIDYLAYATKINAIDAAITKAKAQLADNTKTFIRDSLKQFKDAAISMFTEITKAAEINTQHRIDAIDKEISKIDEQISKQQEAVDEQKKLSEEGFANSLQLEKDRLNSLQNIRDQEVKQKEEQQRQLAKIQAEANALRAADIAEQSIEQAVNLETAAAKIFKANSGIPILGVVLAIAAVASLVAGFLAIKNSIRSATQKFGMGDIVKGKRHAHGGNKYVSLDMNDPEVMEIEEGEYITNRESTRKHKALLDAINRDELGNWTYNDLKKFLKPSGLSFDYDKHGHLAGMGPTLIVAPQLSQENKSDQLLERIAQSNEQLLKMEEEHEEIHEYPDRTVYKKKGFTRVIHKNL